MWDLIVSVPDHYLSFYAGYQFYVMLKVICNYLCICFSNIIFDQL